ncbi:MAG TPA: (d)CMP kinase [Pseudogracilibacillus sp.]|nr:(d)CMP kinase [Pseudogracilibacillus sp.]
MVAKQRLRIAIDGPAAAGKSTVAKRLAKDLSYIYVDTGAMYRALTLHCLRNNLSLTDEEAVYNLLLNTKIELKQTNDTQRVLLNGEDVTEAIRSNDVSRKVSIVAKLGAIRKEMLARQREMASNGNVIMDGRDIGTNVLPDAEVKFYLIASVDERAKRRYEENIKKGIPTTLEQLKKEIAERDRRDMEREHAPLKQAEDAIAIDTTSLSIEEVVSQMLKHVNKVRNFREES